MTAAASIGVSYGDFLRMTPAGLAAVAKGYRQRANAQAWLNGLYMQDALAAVLSAALGGKGTKVHKYPDAPYNILQEEAEVSEESEAARAKAYMMQMVRAGRGWGQR